MKRINVLYQFNEKYAPFAGVSLTSLFENNKEIDKIKVYVLEEKVSDNNKKKLEKLVYRYGREIEVIDSEFLISLMKEIGIPQYRGSYTTNMKMFVPLVIKEKMERLLYLDSDTIITGSILNLLTIDMLGCPLAMAMDSLGKNHAVQIGLKKEDKYFNAGVILFDIRKWKEEKYTEQIIHHVKNVRAHYMAPDQDLINVVLNRKISTLGLEYNLQPIHYVYEPNQYFKFNSQKPYYSLMEIEEAVKNPIILHCFRFLGQFPWHKNSLHPYIDFFDYYLNISEWNDYQKQPSEQDGVIFKVERMLYNKIPKIIFLLTQLSQQIFPNKA